MRRAGWPLALALLATVAAPQLISFGSLTAYGRDELGLTANQALLVPVMLDGAGVASAILVAKAAAAGRGGGLARFMMWACTIASALANARHGSAIGTDATVALGLAPVFATGMLEVALRERHREALEGLGAVQPPLPRFGLVRWVRFPSSTWAGWSRAVRDGLTDRREALAAAEVPAAPAPRAAPLPPPPPPAPAVVPEPAEEPAPAGLPPAFEVELAGTPLSAMPKGGALKLALDFFDGDQRRALAFLAGHGVKMSTGTSSKAIREWREAQAEARRLRAVDTR